MNQAVESAVKDLAAKEAESIDIPLSAHVRCPLVEFKLRAVAGHCPGCEHFRGLEQKYAGGEIPFERRYSVLCHARPAARDLFEVEVSA
jgi:hypothetical protein